MKNQTGTIMHIGKNSLSFLKNVIEEQKSNEIFVLTDETTGQYCLPLIAGYLENFIHIPVKSGEEHKTINSCCSAWGQLAGHNASRKAVLLCLGGGMICDMGGFIASTFKRGIDFILIPTTLLAMCDASIGGKVGVNFDHLKNYIGLFRQPIAIISDPVFLKTLTQKHVISGFAEIIKHAIIADAGLFSKINHLKKIPENIEDFIHSSVKIKQQIVRHDMHEQGIRKQLNFGHSIGHAIESYFINHQSKVIVTHGEAVAAGMVIEAFISNCQHLLSNKEFEKIYFVVSKFFKKIKIPDSAINTILALTVKDKKNLTANHLMSFPDRIGNCLIDVEVHEQEIIEALKFYQEK